MAAYLPLAAVLRHIQHAVDRKRAFSLVRVGDGENIVLAQRSVWPLKKVLQEPWTKRKDIGLPLPSLRLRNDVVRSIRNASVVGMLAKNDRMIQAPRYLKRHLTDQVFRHFQLRPSLTCNACVNRIMSSHPLFRKLVKGRRILLINRNPKSIQAILERPPYQAKVTAMIPFTHYSQISRTVQKVEQVKQRFDIALISCGVNAVILAPKIAQATGKVAIDFGQAPPFVKRK